MSTRRLIAAALVCGLAILLAGGVFLVNLAANRDDITVPDFLAVADSAVVGGAQVAVVDVDREAVARQLLVTVRFTVLDQEEWDDGGWELGEGWTLVNGGNLHKPVDDAAVAHSCLGLHAVSGPIDCTLLFPVASGTAYIEYARGDGSARWRLD